MNTKETYLKLVCGDTSDLNVHYVDTKEVNGIQVSSVIADPSLRTDLDKLSGDYEFSKRNIYNSLDELSAKLDHEIERSESQDALLNAEPRELRQLLRQEIEDRANADSLITSDIGSLRELNTNSKNSIVSAINELKKDISDLGGGPEGLRVETYYNQDPGHEGEVIYKELHLGSGFKITIYSNGEWKITTPRTDSIEILELE